MYRYRITDNNTPFASFLFDVYVDVPGLNYAPI